MTTHLIIADDVTLDRMFEQADEKLDYGDRDNVLCDAETGDTWHFVTPTGPRVDIPKCDFAYKADHSITAFGILYRALRHHEHPVDRILPLIAACDLLGVDEL